MDAATPFSQPLVHSSWLSLGEEASYLHTSLPSSPPPPLYLGLTSDKLAPTCSFPAASTTISTVSNNLKATLTIPSNLPQTHTPNHPSHILPSVTIPVTLGNSLVTTIVYPPNNNEKWYSIHTMAIITTNSTHHLWIVTKSSLVITYLLLPRPPPASPCPPPTPLLTPPLSIPSLFPTSPSPITLHSTAHSPTSPNLLLHLTNSTTILLALPTPSYTPIASSQYTYRVLPTKPYCVKNSATVTACALTKDSVLIATEQPLPPAPPDSPPNKQTHRYSLLTISLTPLSPTPPLSPTILATTTSPVTLLALPPSSNYIAILTAENLLVTTISLDNTILNFTADGKLGVVADMKWCGDDAVALLYRNAATESAAVLIGPYGDYRCYTYNSALSYAVTTPSSLLIHLGDNTTARLTRTPACLSDVSSPGSLKPAAIIMSAHRDFLNGDVSSDSAVKTLPIPAVTSAISTLLDAGRACETPEDGKVLLRAAGFGLTFLREQKGIARKFRASAQAMRVLNTVRKLGIDVSGAEYESLGGVEYVIGMLELIGKHKLMLTLTEYIPCQQRIKLRAIEAQCKALIASAVNTNETTQHVVRLLRAHNDQFLPAQFARLGIHANELGNLELAESLMRCEVDHVERTYGYLKLSAGKNEGTLRRQWVNATQASVRSRNPALMSAVLAEIEGSVRRDAFIEMFIKEPRLPFECYQSKKFEWALTDRMAFMGLVLRANTFAESKFADAAAAKRYSNVDAAQIKCYDAIKTAADPVPHLLEAKKVLIGKDLSVAFMRACVDEQLDLITEQELACKMYEWDSKAVGDGVIGLVKAIVRQVALDPREATKIFAHADGVAKKFKLVEKRYQIAKCRALAECEQWSQMRLMMESKQGKANIGGTDVPAKAAIEFGAGKGEVERFIEAVVSKEERYGLFYSVNDWKNAAKVARAMGDTDRMMEVRGRCDEADRGVIEQIINS